MSFHDKGIGYYIPPELKDFGKGAYDLFKTVRPFNPENLPTYDFNKPFKQNILDIITDAGILGLDFATLGTASIPRNIALKVGDEVVDAAKATRSEKIKETMKSEKFKETIKAKMSDKVEQQLNTEGVVKILEDIRTGKTSLKEGSSSLNNILPNQAMFGSNKAGRGFYRLFENYNLTRATDKDIFDTAVYGYPYQGKAQLIGATKKKDIVDAIEQAENVKTGENFAINFRNIYHNITKGEDQPIQKLSTVEMYNIKEILKAMNKNPDILNLERAAGVKISDDGTSIYQLPIDQASLNINKAWNSIKKNSLIEGEGATKKLKSTIKTNGSDVNFNQVKAQIFKNNVITSKLDNLKNLFENLQGESFYSLDHIQPKIFGGSDEINNLRFIMEGPHNSIKKLPAGKTATQESVVKSKSNFEKNVYSMAKEIVRLVKKGELEEAKKISKEINTLQNNFKNTFKNTDFIVGEAYVPIKTGDDTANYIKFSEHLNLNSKQQKQVSNLIPTYKNLPNKNKSLEKGLDDIVEAYQGVSLLFPSGKIPKEYVGQMASMKQGGIAGIDYTTRPLDGTR